jgi:four helix bundle protein
VADYRDLDLYKCAHRLALNIYRATGNFPGQEKYGLTSQMRRAAVSIPSNIAEGAGRRSPKDFSRFLRVAVGSANELECQLSIARDLGLLDSPSYEASTELVARTRQLLDGFIRSLNRQPPS